MISQIVTQVCEAIWLRMQPIYLPVPTERMWRQKAIEFEERWHFRNCLSAIDGKHIIFKKPLKSGSDFFNYKKAFSIVLLAGADANYKFTFVDIRTKGRFSDGFVFANSTFGKKLSSNQLNIPAPSPLVENGPPIPHVLAADAAFPLGVNMMHPYPGTSTRNNEQNRIFNYRLSHARQVIECTFGIMSA